MAKSLDASAPAVSAALELPPPSARLDRSGTILELDAHWDARIAAAGPERLSGEALIGRTVWDFLDADPARRALWRGFLEAATSAGACPPPAPTDSTLRRLRPWPAAGEGGNAGVWLRLDLEAPGKPPWLHRPLFQACAGQLTALNSAARELSRGLGDDAGQIEARLAARQPAARLEPVPDLRLDDRPVLTPRAPAPHDVEAFSMLARAVRSALHDLSNPLSAMRMMTEVLVRTEETGSERASTLRDLSTYLDQSIAVIAGLRTLVRADSAVQVLDVRRELEAVASLIGSDFRRRELDIEIAAADPEDAQSLVAGSGSFRLIALAGLLMSCERAQPGDTLRLTYRGGPAGVQEMSCENLARPGAGPAGVEALGRPGAAALLEQLVGACDGRLSVGSASGPDWRIRFGDPDAL
ncbi:MAG: hypothetical protein AAF725_00430 [Acidobacteriota bacterium]